MSAAPRIVEHVTCLGCGCACDDIRLKLLDERIMESGNACWLGAAWFGDGRVPARALVGGRPSSVDEALDAAAAMLSASAHPLVYLAPDLTCEAQREAVALADRLRAVVDSVTSATAIKSLLAAQERGRATATLGEVRNRADLVVWWGVDPALRYPRYAARYVPAAAALSTGKEARAVVAVDVGEARGPAVADRRFTVVPDNEVDTLMAILGAVEGGGERGEGPGIGPGFETAAELTQMIRAARYAVIVADAEPDAHAQGQIPFRADALIAVAQAFNGPTRCALSLLRAGGNRSGADAVLTWQTGYPAAVDFSRGHPRYRPHDGSARARLARGDVDAVLIVGSAALVPDTLAGPLDRVPVAVVGPRASESVFASGVAAIDTGVAGIHEAGMGIRMDEVPVRLQAPIVGATLTQAITRALSERIVARQRNAGQGPGAPVPR